MSGRHETIAIGLMASIRYQVFVPQGSTLGPCPRCHNDSRGSLTCADCAGAELDKLLRVEGSPEFPCAYLTACRMQLAQEQAVIASARRLDESGVEPIKWSGRHG